MDKENKYKDSSLPIETRVDNLLGKMTVEEKIAQIQCTITGKFYNGDQLDEGKIASIIGNGIGEIHIFGGTDSGDVKMSPATITKLQKFLTEKTRLGIPAIVHLEAISGAMIQGATSFPSGIALAATWNQENNRQMTNIIKHQMRAVGFTQAMSPVMDVARDMRWGRVGETYGEDPYLCGQMSIAFTRGIQGENLKDGVAATGKHFLGYALSHQGINQSRQPIPSRELYEIYAFPFEAAIREGKLASIMNSYGEIDGIPIIASPELLTDLLRNKMGFNGIIVSDYMSLQRLVDDHQIAENPLEAGVLGLKAGLDVECQNPYGFTSSLVDAIKNETISEELINAAVKRVLTMKFRLGLFENPYPKKEYSKWISKEENKEFSRNLASQSMVLLKNENNLLPLNKNINSIAVIGPNADSVRGLFGCYTIPAGIDMLKGFFNSQTNAETDALLQAGTEESIHESSETMKLSLLTKMMMDGVSTESIVKEAYPGIYSPLDGIKKIVSENTRIMYAEGCPIKEKSENGFNNAIQAAKQSDAAILFFGGRYGWDAKCTSGEGIDTSDLSLPGSQQQLLEAIVSTGTPVILVLLDGKPFSIPWAAENVPAIIEAWTPGQEGGLAIADVIFGDVNPGGKLPITIPRSVGQVPIHYAHYRGSGYTGVTSEDSNTLPGYWNESFLPLYAFGHGLSYTTFEYSDMELFKESIVEDEFVSLSFTVKNSGDIVGDEIVQIYFSCQKASMVRPQKQLVAFKRITIDPNEIKKLNVKVPVSLLAYLNREMNLVVEPGIYDVQVGSSSEDIRLSGTFKFNEFRQFKSEERKFSSQVFEHK